MHLTTLQLAQSFGVAESVVEDWVRRDGLPCLNDRGRPLFDRAEVLAWAAQRGLAAEAGFLGAPEPALPAGIGLARLFDAGGIRSGVLAASLLDVLEAMVLRLPGAPEAVRRVLSERLRAPDGISWAPVGGRLALPHLRSPVTLGREAGLLAAVQLADDLPLASPDGLPIRGLLFFVAPSPRAHLELLAMLSKALKRTALGRLLLEGATEERLRAALAEAGTSPRAGER